MSKAILVMDMPESCLDCLCRGFAGICNLKNKDVKYNGKRPKWCPLKEVPQKKYFTEAEKLVYGKSFILGYNACIDEILGGGE